ncbi:hypothetical protein CLOM_g23985 [Closterium sp. NIES-68]|nr:hypothetical protein CLOM_g23985 [Closterium sp. NIES-68]
MAKNFLDVATRSLNHRFVTSRALLCAFEASLNSARAAPVHRFSARELCSSSEEADGRRSPQVADGRRSPQETDGRRSPPIFELRTYRIVPGELKSYLDATRRFAALRKELSPGWRGFWTVETGGVLNEVYHFYCYPGGWGERDAVRAGMASSSEWTQCGQEWQAAASGRSAGRNGKQQRVDAVRAGMASSSEWTQ